MFPPNPTLPITSILLLSLTLLFPLPSYIDRNSHSAVNKGRLCFFNSKISQLTLAGRLLVYHESKTVMTCFGGLDFKDSVTYVLTHTYIIFSLSI